MKLILEETFDVENVVELNESTNQKTYVIKGTFSTPDKKNRNGRIYASKLWEDNVTKYQSEIQGKTTNTLMEKEHPPRTAVDPWSAVAQIRKLEMREGLVYGEAELLNIPETATMRALIDKGIKIGVSSRGVGKMKGEIVEEFNLITYDIVSTPSDYNANLNGFNESMILEGVDIEINEKGQYICTPEGCKLAPLDEGVKKVFGGYKFELEGDTILMAKDGKILATKTYPSLTSVQMKMMIKDYESAMSEDKEAFLDEGKSEDVSEMEHGEDCKCDKCKAKTDKEMGEKMKAKMDKKDMTECEIKALKLAEAFNAFAGVISPEEKELTELKEKFNARMGRKDLEALDGVALVEGETLDLHTVQARLRVLIDEAVATNDSESWEKVTEYKAKFADVEFNKVFVEAKDSAELVSKPLKESEDLEEDFDWNKAKKELDDKAMSKRRDRKLDKDLKKLSTDRHAILVGIDFANKKFAENGNKKWSVESKDLNKQLVKLDMKINMRVNEGIKVNTQAICDEAKKLSPENQAKVFAFVLSLT